MPIYRLETFGKLTLSGPTAGKLSQQRRRLALLALLAASGDRGLSRDQLLAYLWPERAAGAGRHSLEQLLYAMRQALGDIFAGVNPVQLDGTRITSDVNEFEQAVARGDLTTAVALYDGPFLQGFYVEDAPEFERWTETERARLARRHAECLERLAEQAETEGDRAATVQWRRRLAEVDPISSRNALGLMRALVASGDRTAALQHARIYEALVQQELASEPDPSIIEYAASLRAGGDDHPITTPTTASSARRGVGSIEAPVQVESVAPPPPMAWMAPAAADVPAAVAPTRVGILPPATAPAQPDTPTARARPMRWWLTAAALAAVGLLAVTLVRPNGRAATTRDANRIVVLPFRTAGADSSVKYLGEGVVDLLAPLLTGEGGPAAVDARTAISSWNRITAGRDGTADDARRVARELGAGLALTGSIVDVGGMLTITGTVISADNDDTRSLTSITAPDDSVNTLLDRFAGQLLARQSGIPEPSLSAITSHSLPAIRAYLAGRAAYRRADDERAIESFTRALEIDSTFALAGLDLAVATGKLLRARLCVGDECRVFSIVPGMVLLSERMDDQFDRAIRLAWESRSKLGRRDLPLLDAFRGESFPRESSARQTMASLARAVSAAPDRPEAQYLLGVFLLYQGPALGIGDSRVQAEAAFREASRLDSSYLAPLARLVDVAAFEGDMAKVQRAGAHYLARDTAGVTADYVRWLVAASEGDTGTLEAIRARFHSLHPATLRQIYLTAQMTGLALEDADRAAPLVIERTTNPVDRSVALRRAQLLALNRGRPAEAEGFIRRRREMGTSEHQYRNFAILAALFDDGDLAAADSAIRAAARSLARDTLAPLESDALMRASEAMVSQAMWDLKRGDTARALAAADWLRRHPTDQSRNRALIVLPEMLLASHARKPEGAALRAFVDSIALEGCCELSAYASIALAEAYEASGDDVAALRVIRRGLWLFPPRALATQRREEGRLAAKLGDRDGAVRAYRHYLALRSDPEPGLRPARDSVRAEVEGLERTR